jgi:hypothetical protein
MSCDKMYKEMNMKLLLFPTSALHKVSNELNALAALTGVKTPIPTEYKGGLFAEAKRLIRALLSVES